MFLKDANIVIPKYTNVKDATSYILTPQYQKILVLMKLISNVIKNCNDLAADIRKAQRDDTWNSSILNNSSTMKLISD